MLQCSLILIFINFNSYCDYPKFLPQLYKYMPSTSSFDEYFYLSYA